MAYSTVNNPIRAVNGNAVPCPSSYEWKLSDVSAPDAGRTEDAIMHKKRIAQKVHIELEWQNVTQAVASDILNAFDGEYFTVTYFDPKANGYQTKTFYAGDRGSPMYNMSMGIQSGVAFNIIER